MTSSGTQKQLWLPLPETVTRFLLGPGFSLSRLRERPMEGRGWAQVHVAAGDRQGFRGVGAVSSTEVMETQRQSPRETGTRRDPTAMKRDPGMSGSQPSRAPCTPLHPPAPASPPEGAYLCVTESPMSLRTICGDPCGRSAGRGAGSAGWGSPAGAACACGLLC